MADITVLQEDGEIMISTASQVVLHAEVVNHVMTVDDDKAHLVLNLVDGSSTGDQESPAPEAPSKPSKSTPPSNTDEENN